MPLLRDIIELMSEQEEVSKELDSEMWVSISNLTICAKKAVQRELDFVPAFSHLVERMHYRETVEGVIFEISLAHELVGLSG